MTELSTLLSSLPLIILIIALISTIAVIFLIIGLNVLTKKIYSIGLFQPLVFYDSYIKLSHNEPLLADKELYRQVASLGVSLAPKYVYFPDTKSKEWWTIYTPRWRGKYFMENVHLRQSLETKFLEKLERIPGDKTLCAITLPAIKFMANILVDLRNINVIPMDLNISAPKGRKAILFDLVVNTGRTMNDACEVYIKQNGKRPFAYTSFLFNDFLPPYYRRNFEKWVYQMFHQRMKENASFYLFTVTDLIPYFDDNISETLISLHNRLCKQQIMTPESVEEFTSLRESWSKSGLPFEP